MSGTGATGGSAVDQQVKTLPLPHTVTAGLRATPAKPPPLSLPQQEQQQQQQPVATINSAVVKKLLQLHWSKDPAADGAKINPDAAVLAAEYLRLFVVEAQNRAMLEAELDGDEAVEPQHIERVMLGLMLDF